MKSAQRGKSTFAAEVTNVSRHGFWLFVDGEELFLRFRDFPWFRNSTIGQLVDVKRPSAQHLYWPVLDVDLCVDSIKNPERFPLVSRVSPDPEPKPPTRTSARSNLTGIRSVGRSPSHARRAAVGAKRPKRETPRAT